MTESKHAVVTGGARGIGKAITEKFMEEDWFITVHYNSSEKPASELKKHSNIEVLQANFTEKSGLETMQDYIKSNAPDSFVNNAGIVGTRDLSQLSLSEFESTLRANAVVPFFLAREASNCMKEGTIVNVTSIRGQRNTARPGIIDYCASKASLENITASLAQQYAPQVRVNAVAPGFTDTAMTSGLDDETRNQVCEETPMNRFGQSNEIAQAVYFLASSRSSFCTGETLVVDGGYSIQG